MASAAAASSSAKKYDKLDHWRANENHLDRYETVETIEVKNEISAQMSQRFSNLGNGKGQTNGSFIGVGVQYRSQLNK